MNQKAAKKCGGYKKTVLINSNQCRPVPAIKLSDLILDHDDVVSNGFVSTSCNPFILASLINFLPLPMITGVVINIISSIRSSAQADDAGAALPMLISLLVSFFIFFISDATIF